MKKFRLPRKIKKSLKGKFWLYPADSKGNLQMAFPDESQEDYTALKQGIVKDMMQEENRKTRKEQEQIDLDKEVIVSDEILKSYVDSIIRKDLRTSFYSTLLRAKNNPKAIVAYYNFVNAYQLVEQGEDSYGNICCLAVDRAIELLKKPRK